MITKNIREPDKLDLENRLGIRTTRKIKYLGIWIIGNKMDLFKDNYEVTWKKIKNNMNTWGEDESFHFGKNSNH